MCHGIFGVAADDVLNGFSDHIFYLFYFIAKSYTYQKYGIQHRYTIII